MREAPALRRVRRFLLITASSFLAAIAIGYAILAWRAPEMLATATFTCIDCVGRGPDEEACATQPGFRYVVLFPWLEEERRRALADCEGLALRAKLMRVTSADPSREERDRVAARIVAARDPADVLLLYRAGAAGAYFEARRAIVEMGAAYALLAMAVRSRSRERLRETVAYDGAFEAFAHIDGRRGAWLCLLGEEAEGRRILERGWRSAQHAPPDYFRDVYQSPLALYACGGARPDIDTIGEGHEVIRPGIRHLALVRGELSPTEALALPRKAIFEPSRRLALALALEEERPGLERMLSWLRWTSSEETHSCTPGELIDARWLQTEPPVARRGAARLLAWQRENETALRELEARLPELPAQPAIEDEREGRGARPAALMRFIQRTAADLYFDAGLAEAGRGRYARAQRDFERASEVSSDRRCDYATVLAGGRPPAGDAPPDLEHAGAYAQRLAWAGREQEAFDVLTRVAAADRVLYLDQSLAFPHAALGVRLGREPPSVFASESARFPEASFFWRAARRDPGSRRDARVLAQMPVAPFADYELPAISEDTAFRMFVVGALAEGEDVEVYLDRLQFTVGRSSIHARALAAEWRGDQAEARAWRAWRDEIAALASTPARAALLALAFGELWAPPGLTRGYAPSHLEPPGSVWSRAVSWTVVDACQDEVWALVPDHLPAEDDAELANNTLDHAATAARAMTRVFLVQESAEVILRDRARGEATLRIAGAHPCELEPSSYENRRWFGSYDELAELPIADEVIDETHLGAAVHLGFAAPAIEVHGPIRGWRTPPYTVVVPLAALPTDPERAPFVVLAVRARHAHVDRRSHDFGAAHDPPGRWEIGAGVFLQGDVVAIRVVRDGRVVYEREMP